MTRPASEIEADDMMAPPSPTASVATWDAWCERLAPGEYTDASLFRWLEGLARASSGLVVSDDIASDARMSGPARVVYAALCGLDASSDPAPTITARIFGHEDSELRSIVDLAIVELERLGMATRTLSGGVML